MTVSWKKQAVGWVLTGLVLVYIGFTTDLDSFAITLLNAKLPLFLLAILILSQCRFLLIPRHFIFCLSRQGLRFPLLMLFELEASFLFNIVNYQLALVSMAAILNKRTDKGRGGCWIVLFLGLRTFGPFPLWRLLGFHLVEHFLSLLSGPH